MNSAAIQIRKIKTEQLIDIVNQCGQLTIEFSYFECQLFLGIAKSTTTLDTITILDEPPQGILQGLVLVAITSIFFSYLYKIVSFLHREAGCISGVLEKAGKKFHLKISKVPGQI